MNITAEHIKGAMKYTQRIFFVSEYSEMEETRTVIDYEATAKALNRMLEFQQGKED